MLVRAPSEADAGDFTDYTVRAVAATEVIRGKRFDGVPGTANRCAYACRVLSESDEPLAPFDGYASIFERFYEEALERIWLNPVPRSPKENDATSRLWPSALDSRKWPRSILMPAAITSSAMPS